MSIAGPHPRCTSRYSAERGPPDRCEHRDATGAKPALNPLRLPDVLIKTADEVYIRLHGPQRWYRHDYSKAELADWAARIEGKRAEACVDLFQQRFRSHAPGNARSMKRLFKKIERAKPMGVPAR